MTLRSWPLITVALIIVTLCIGYAAPEPSRLFDLLVLDRNHIRPWQWLTAHLLHTDPAHLWWNVLALACLGWLGETQAPLRFAAAMLMGIVAVDIWFALPGDPLRFYCGLSGALNTVLLVTLYAMRGSVPTALLVAVAAAVALKIGWEQASGTALFTHTRWPSAVSAHLAGYCAGLLLVGLYAWRDRVHSVTNPGPCERYRGTE